MKRFVRTSTRSGRAVPLARRVAAVLAAASAVGGCNSTATDTGQPPTAVVALPLLGSDAAADGAGAEPPGTGETATQDETATAPTAEVTTPPPEPTPGLTSLATRCESSSPEAAPRCDGAECTLSLPVVAPWACLHHPRPSPRFQDVILLSGCGYIGVRTRTQDPGAETVTEERWYDERTGRLTASFRAGDACEGKGPPADCTLTGCNPCLLDPLSTRTRLRGRCGLEDVGLSRTLSEDWGAR
jgi:hypothetical protein